MDKQTVFQMDS